MAGTRGIVCPPQPAYHYRIGGYMYRLLIALILLCISFVSWSAVPLSVSLAPSTSNPTSPQMGDHLQFHSVIRNNSGKPLTGIVAWISLVQVDPGHEQPMDLEDWSAHKAVVQQQLKPSETMAVDWPMRLIQSGTYRVVISALDHNAQAIITSPFVDFHVRRKPVVESRRILPIALGMPFLLVLPIAWRLLRRTHR